MSQLPATKLHVAHWALYKGNQSLVGSLPQQHNSTTKSGLGDTAGITTRDMFKAYDAQARERHPALVCGELGTLPTNREERLSWHLPSVLTDLLTWLNSEQGQPWRDGPIWLFIPETKEQRLLWALQAVLMTHFKQRQQPYPVNLLIYEASEQQVMQHLSAGYRGGPQIVVTADSQLDTDYVGRHSDIATTASGSGRLIAEAICWVALLPEANGHRYTTEFAEASKADNQSLNELTAHGQAWLTPRYRVGSPVLLNHLLPTTDIAALNRLGRYSQQLFPPTTAPQKIPTKLSAKNKQAVTDAIDAAVPLEHTIEQLNLHNQLGDCGLSNTLTGLVFSLEQLASAPNAEMAVVYQESTDNMTHFLISKEAS